jgi:predicted amidohydrolase YtcJ
MTRAELIFHNGTIRTNDTKQPTVEAVAVANGRVIATGQREAVDRTSHANTRHIDLEGRTLIPGFHDLCVQSLSETGDINQYEVAVMATAKRYVQGGITSVIEFGADPIQLDVYRVIATERRLPLRTNAIAMRYDATGNKIPLPERSETNWLRIDTVRLIAEDDSGKLAASEDQLRAMVWDIHRAGLRATIWAKSEAAIELAVNAIAYAGQRLPSRIKHRIEPFSNPNEVHIRRCREHSINVVVQPMQAGVTLHKLWDAGVIFGFGSLDRAMLNPMSGLQTAGQYIGIENALRVYTSGGAIVAGEEHLKGSITVGKYADFAVLSGDPVRAPIERLADLQVEMTIINGLTVYAR